MRLDLFMMGVIREAPGSWPGLMGLAGVNTEEITWVTHTEQVETSHLIQSIHTVYTESK